jgi:phospholipid transport system substrate-binding protein
MLHRLTLVTALAACMLVAAPLSAAAQATPAPAPTAAATAAQQTPEQIVQGIADQLGNAIDGHRDELKHNQAKLIDIIDEVFLPHFDIDYASILVLGQHAREATPAQRERFAKAFYKSITDRYAEGLLNYSRGRVKVLPFNGNLNDKRSVVRTQVVLDDGKLISVDYAFRKNRNGDWKAYDVIIEGISYVTNYRNQVDAEIRKVGIDKLISNLETQGDKALSTIEKDSKGAQ